MQHHQACECWGCGSLDHVYSRTGTIFCPRASEPEVLKAKFDVTRKDFQECRRDQIYKTVKKCKNINTSTILSSLMQDDEQLEALRALLTKKPNMTSATCQDFIPNLPPFLFLIGQPSTDNPGFKLSITYDTFAVLNIGWAGFHLAIVKRKHPHLVKSLVWVKDVCTPLTLSGFVSHDEKDTAFAEKRVTTLPAVIEYYMPHPIKQGHPTSFKVAIGNNVAVNTLIGMSMIRLAKFSLDLEDDLIDSGILDTEPFPVTYKQTSRSLPNLASITDSSEHTLAIFSEPHVSLDMIKTCIAQAFPSM
jgi:hypothetical protein